MGDAIVDDVKRVLSEADMPAYCPKCGSREVSVYYKRNFIANLDDESSEEHLGSDAEPYNITCLGCKELLYED